MSDNKPGLPDFEEDTQSIIDEYEEDEPKKNKKPFVIFLVVFVIALVLGLSIGLFKIVSAELESDIPEIQDEDRVDPVQIASIRPAPLMPIDSPVDNGKDETKRATIEVDPATPVPNSTDTNLDTVVPSFENGGVDFTSIEEKLDQVSNQMANVVQRIDDIESAQQSFQSQNRTDQAALKEINTQINRLSRELSNLSKVKQEEIKSKPTQRSQQPEPPAPMSFAIWNGRDAVMVEYPIGKIRLLYKSDTVGSWRVIDLKSNSVTYQSTIDQHKRTLKLGE
ncbi:hypothetical protein [Thiomicrospira sp.]|uniref:hypothetical protein n=1 Tax=Thiomicrospira sp. TaxID=935 RepID=UPI002F9544EA